MTTYRFFNFLKFRKIYHCSFHFFAHSQLSEPEKLKLSIFKLASLLSLRQTSFAKNLLSVLGTMLPPYKIRMLKAISFDEVNSFMTPRR